MDFMEYRLSGFKNDNTVANQFGHNVFYINVLIRSFYYLLEKRINTRILFLMTTYRRVLANGEKFPSYILAINKVKTQNDRETENVTIRSRTL